MTAASLKQSILIVDDNEQSRYVISRSLRQADYEIWEAYTGREALELAKRKPSLIILDVKLPDINGFDVCRQLKKNPVTSFIPVLQTSATFVRSADRIQGLDEGADAYLALPIEPAEVVATVKSLIRMRKAEAEAINLAIQWEATFDAINDGICLVDDAGVVVRCNRGLAALLGKPVADIVGRPFTDPSSGAILDAVIYERFKRSFRREVIENKIGDRWFRITLDPVMQRDEGWGAVCVVCNITDQKSHEHLISGQKDILERAASGAPISQLLSALVTLIESQAPGCTVQVLMVEDGKLKVGASSRLLDEYNAALADVPYDAKRYSAFCDAAASGDVISTTDIRGDPRWGIEWKKNTEKFGLKACVCAPIWSPDKTILGTFILYFHERRKPDPSQLNLLEVSTRQAELVIDRIRSEMALNEANRTLEKKVAERTALLTETTSQLESFCYTISHDLRAPLRTQQAFAGILLENYGPQLDEEGRGHLQRIVKAAGRLDRLVSDLLAYSRISRSELRFEPIAWEGIVREMPVLFQEEIKDKGANVSIGTIESPVWGHFLSLETVITNLFGNALKFVSPGVAPRIKIWTERGAGAIRLSVQDNGIGIAIEHHERIFGVFQRLHTFDEYPGTGIGLAIVRKAVERMNGRLGLSSEPGRGSVFWVELPSF